MIQLRGVHIVGTVIGLVQVYPHGNEWGGAVEIRSLDKICSVANALLVGLWFV